VDDDRKRNSNAANEGLETRPCLVAMVVLWWCQRRCLNTPPQRWQESRQVVKWVAVTPGGVPQGLGPLVTDGASARYAPVGIPVGRCRVTRLPFYVETRHQALYASA
jgi:hypothetical protein